MTAKTHQEIYDMIADPNHKLDEVYAEIRKLVEIDEDETISLDYTPYIRGEWISTWHGVKAEKGEDGEWKFNDEVNTWRVDMTDKEAVIQALVDDFYNYHGDDDYNDTFTQDFDFDDDDLPFLLFSGDDEIED